MTVGNIEVAVTASGFSKEVHPPFTLILNQIARLDFQLKVGNVSQTVEVTAAPPLLQTDSTELGTLLDSTATTALPLSTRNVNQLVLLTPGVVSPNIFAFQAPQATFGTGRPYVNGAREQDNNFSLDGMDTNQADNNEVGYVPGVDAVQEFNIIAGNAPADFGNYIGGVVVETLKSGTNQYHGDIFEFLRNTVLNANTWQNKAISQFNQQPAAAERFCRAIRCSGTILAQPLAVPLSRTSCFSSWITRNRSTTRPPIQCPSPRCRLHFALAIFHHSVPRDSPLAFATLFRNSSTTLIPARIRRPEHPF